MKVSKQNPKAREDLVWMLGYSKTQVHSSAEFTKLFNVFESVFFLVN